MCFIKERPRCRRAIIERRIRPHLVNGRWDGFRGVLPDGTRTFVSSGLQKQMRKMIAEGFWPEVEEQ